MILWKLQATSWKNLKELLFGKKLLIGKQISDFARKYHGYYFAWATIYAFWRHPMENTIGRLTGFLYKFLLLLQCSLFVTNPRPKFTKEQSA